MFYEGRVNTKGKGKKEELRSGNDGKMISREKLSAVRQECDELIAIFVTILKRSKETS
jgi:hypothetical protein